MDFVKSLVENAINDIESRYSPLVDRIVCKMRVVDCVNGRDGARKYGRIVRIKRREIHSNDRHKNWPYRWIAVVRYDGKEQTVPIDQLIERGTHLEHRV